MQQQHQQTQQQQQQQQQRRQQHEDVYFSIDSLSLSLHGRTIRNRTEVVYACNVHMHCVRNGKSSII